MEQQHGELENDIGGNRMDSVERFAVGEIGLEEVLLQDDGPTEGQVTILLDLSGEETAIGVRDHGTAPVFTHIPVGLYDGFGAGAARVFEALDRTPHQERRGHDRLGTNSPSPEILLAPDQRPAVVWALADLAKEVSDRADS
ncbi:MAG: hypothetical protein ACE5Q6_19480 [Dehalococcoidia bacterium]